ncbi:MAG: succinate dehydrogenase/fumarate reductase flavoprotein subunit [Peptococcaceae bacterium]|nr:succinate dehydrogenase/fumarate reductase flavoprotein subunit [Peptococcaceae bacterium]
MKVYTIDTDILIIGGGSAGVMAAIRAKELNPAQRVVVFEKGQMKYSGCIPRGMDALNIVTVPGINSPEDYVEDTIIGCEGIIDEGPSYVMAQRSWDLMKKLESWGVCFPKYNGEYEVLKAHAKGRYTLTMKEPDLKTKLYERVANTDTIVLNRTMALEFIVEDGRVAGAIGMNIRTGELIICNAKAVILTAGGAARFGLPGNGYLYGVYDCPANTGDGYMMAYKAGAELSGLEYTLHYYIIKDISSPLLYITLTRGAHLLNALDERLDLGHPSIKSIIAEHQKGFGYVRIRMSHLSEEQIRGIEDILFTTEKPACERFFKGRGVNFRSKDIELGPTETYLCGGHGITGVVVNEQAAASIPGLYCGGDVANVGRGHLSGAFVFGEIAAESATAYVATIKDGKADATGYLEEITRKIEGLQNNRGNITIEEFEYKVRRQINEFIAPPKNEYKLKRGIEVMTGMKKELYEKVKIGRIHDLVKVFEVESIISCAILSAHASLERKESRWGFWHYRPDYPNKDDKNFLKHVIVKKGSNQEPELVLRAPQKVLKRSADAERRV